VACVKAGRQFVGIEKHEPYFDIACRRIERAISEPDMFVAPPANDNAAPVDMFAAPAQAGAA
jgi:DNA modification methylase